MAFWCYILRCADGRYYTGHTDNLDQRIGQHHAGGFCDFTARRQPIMLVWSERFSRRIEALEAERQIKGWSRAKKEALIAGDWSLVSQLAASHGTRPSTGSGRTEYSGSSPLPAEFSGAAQLPAESSGSTPLPVRAEPVEARAPHATAAA